jgi:hypothetical protein
VAADTSAFPAVVERLQAILRPYGERLHVARDTPQGFALEIPGLEGKPAGYMAGVRLGKAYVSYYLMPVYAWPDLVADASPELRRRMQGKACFNFTRVDDRLFSELADVTARGIERWRSQGWPVGQRAYV